LEEGTVASCFTVCTNDKGEI